MKTLSRSFVLICLLSMASPTVFAAWKLDPDASRLSFVSVKNNTIAEAHRFTALDGSIADDGQAVLVIPLDSVETGIPLRNQRLCELLFETVQFPQATASLHVDLKPINSLAVGAHLLLVAEVTVSFHGITNHLPAQLRVTRLGAKQYLVTSEQPVIVTLPISA